MKVDYRNINQYLKENPSANACGHLSNKINLKEFEEVGNLYDGSYGYLSYLALTSESMTEEFVGAYPLQDCKVLKCKTCNQVIFFHFNDGGIGPRPEYFLADYKKDYLPEPAVKSVTISTKSYSHFINEFDLKDQDIGKNCGFEPYITISDKSQIYLFNYREYKGQLTSNFDLVGSRNFLRQVNNWILKMTAKK